MPQFGRVQNVQRKSTRRPASEILLCITLLISLPTLNADFHMWRVQGTAASASFSFTAAGDHGWNPDTDSSLASLASSGADFHIALGDLGYSSDETGWCGYFKNRFNNIEFITGNHDTDETGPGTLSPGYVGACPFTLSSTMTGTYGTLYYFDYPSSAPLVRFILVSAGIGGSEVDGDYSAGTGNYDFVSNAIDGARAGGIPWTVVGMHKGCIYAGDKGNCDVGQDFFDLLFAKRVDLILNAHAHYYERSHQLSCGTSGSFVQSCVVDTDGNFTAGQGSVLVIDGTFGDGNRSVDSADSEAGYFSALMDTDYGFTEYTVSANSISAHFVSSTGTFQDSFNILGNGLGANPPGQAWQPSTLTTVSLIALVLALASMTGLAIFARKRGQKSPSVDRDTK